MTIPGKPSCLPAECACITGVSGSAHAQDAAHFPPLASRIHLQRSALRVGEARGSRQLRGEARAVAVRHQADLLQGSQLLQERSQ